MSELIDEIFPARERTRLIANMIVASIPIFIIGNHGFDPGWQPIGFFFVSIAGAVIAGSLFSINSWAYSSLAPLRIALAAILWNFGDPGRAWAAIFLLLPFSLYLQAIQSTTKTFVSSLGARLKARESVAIATLMSGLYLVVIVPQQRASWFVLAAGGLLALQPSVIKAVGFSRLPIMAALGAAIGLASLSLFSSNIPLGPLIALLPTIWAARESAPRKYGRVAAAVHS